MSTAIDNLDAALKKALAIRPRVGGFPYWRKRCGAPA
jgi:hypothetical protein